MERICIGIILGDVRVRRWVVCLIDGYVVVVGVRHSYAAILFRFCHFLVFLVL